MAAKLKLPIQMPMLDHIHIVLVNTSHPGNIGSVARAMKTMGLKSLYLVAPVHFPHAKADEMASGAVDILQSAVVFDDLSAALADCGLIIGTSARSRTIPWPLVTPREMINVIGNEHKGNQIAIVFGREQTGLTNEELQRCHWHVQIPANPDYSSLNLGAAVQVLAYELRMMTLTHQPCTEQLSNNLPQQWDYRFANAAEMESFFLHLQEMLTQINFLKLNAPRKLMTRLRRLFLRARPDIMEINILRGIINAMQMPKQGDGDG